MSAAAGLGYIRWELPPSVLTLTPRPAVAQGEWQCPMYLPSLARLPLPGLDAVLNASIRALNERRPSGVTQRRLRSECPPPPPGYADSSLDDIPIPPPQKAPPRQIPGPKVGKPKFAPPGPPLSPGSVPDSVVARCRGPYRHWIRGRRVALRRDEKGEDEMESGWQFPVV
eukprot:Hpha_TRINITY_DN33691_c0_g1::TRINITY_DN33691_c0_g1_i1::g.43189::m.43189